MISLEKYRGNGTRFTCPSCNGKKEFTRYIYEDESYLADDVGKCNRVIKCGYHYSPKQFFADNPELQKARKDFLAKKKRLTPNIKRVIKPPDSIDESVLVSSLSDYENNPFVQFLLQLFSGNESLVNEVVHRYFIGTWQKKRTIFWQIDKRRKVRTGKLISYESSTGKRIKNIAPSYVHAELKKAKKLSKDFQLEQCLFGEHLLIEESYKTVAIVEAEKTAVIASILLPNMIWLAAGAMSYLKVEKLERVGDRNIILYPDGNAFKQWSEIANKAKEQGLNVKVSTLIETNGLESDKEAGYDIADYLIEQQKKKSK